MAADYTNRIIKYFDGEMKPGEKELFEEELRKNPELKMEYLIYSSIEKDLQAMIDINEVLEDPDLPEANEMAEALIKDYVEEKEKKSKTPEEEKNTLVNQKMPVESVQVKSETTTIRRLLIPLLAAAAILTGIIVGKIFIFNPSPDKIFEKYYQPIEHASYVSRGPSEVEKADLLSAIGLYNNQYYAEANEILNRLTADETNNLTLILSALSKMELGDYFSAGEILKNISSKNGDYYIESRWYLGMCYLKLNKLPEAKNIFQELSHVPGLYQEPSEEVLGKMGRIDD